MDFVQGVGFPRSGHGLLVAALAKYHTCDPSFDPWAGGGGWIDAAPFRYCDYYHHCRTVPCVNAQTTFSKNHDFGLDLPVRRDYREAA